MTKQGPLYDHYMICTLVKIKMLAINICSAIASLLWFY
jgi:hypothetical protein